MLQFSISQHAPLQQNIINARQLALNNNNYANNDQSWERDASYLAQKQ